MAAKPIIDIGIAVARFEAASVCIEPLERLGFEYRGTQGIPRRHYFVKGDPRTHHVHMLEPESADWRSLVLFRDYLRANERIAGAYARLKQRLAERFPNDRVAYTDGKAAFVARVVELASLGTA
jgi:GrpB-like predicted nucleotidyltransferase (UPF0157 family)